MQLFNFTPFKAEKFMLMDTMGMETLLVIVKATYKIHPDSTLEQSIKQLPIQMADEYYGEPNKSSVKYESDLALNKINTDITLIGHAWSDNPKNQYVDVSIQVDNKMKSVRVFGDRCWDKVLGISCISKPEFFEKIPLIYEKSFGGIDDSNPDPKWHDSEPRNPVGKGFFANKSKKTIEGTPLPNLEDPQNLIKSPKDRPIPVGFGFISRHWQPRRALVGTYDDNWRTKRMPLLPEDFKMEYFNGALYRFDGYLSAKRKIAIINASKEGELKFETPVLNIEAVAKVGDDFKIFDLNVDTLVINTDELTIYLVARGSLNIEGRIYDIQWIKTQFKGTKQS